MDKVSFKQFLHLFEDARGDIETIRLQMATLDKKLSDLNRPIILQKQNLEKRLISLQTRAKQEQEALDRQNEQNNLQSKQQAAKQQATQSGPAPTGRGAPGSTGGSQPGI